MDATTLLGTLLADLLRGAAGAAVHAGLPSGWPSPARLLGGSLTGGARVLVVAAVVAWLVGVLAVLVAASGRGEAGSPALVRPRPPAPLPPRRVRAEAVVPASEPVVLASEPVVPAPEPAVTAPVPPAPAADTTPVPAAAAPALPAPAARPALSGESAAEPPLTTALSPQGAGGAAGGGPVPASWAVASPAVASVAPVAVLAPQHPHENVHPPAPAPSPDAGPHQDPGRCRRCTQPRCWPSTGQRAPARVPGSSAPRACRTSLTAGTAHRCTAADLRCSRSAHGRCEAPPRIRPARPDPGGSRTVAPRR